MCFVLVEKNILDVLDGVQLARLAVAALDDLPVAALAQLGEHLVVAEDVLPGGLQAVQGWRA